MSLYEARTGKKIKSWKIAGADEACPASPSGFLLYSGILPSQWKKLLTGHVEKNVK